MPILITETDHGFQYKPKWYTDRPDKTWIAMSVTANSNRYNDADIDPEQDEGFVGGAGADHQAAIRKWCGAVGRENYYVLAFGGGHVGGTQNSVHEFGPFTSETPNWHWWGTDKTKYDKPSDGLNWTAEMNAGGYYSDGLPESQHTYKNLVFVPDLGDGDGNIVLTRVFTGGWGNPTDTGSKAASFKFNTNDFGGVYEAEATYPDCPSGATRGGGATFDSVSNRVYHIGTSTKTIRWMDMKNPASEGLLTDTGYTTGIRTGSALDPARRFVIWLDSGNNILYVLDVDHDNRLGGNGYGDIESYGLSGGVSDRSSFVYHPTSDAFFAYDGGSTIYKLAIPSNIRSGGALNPSASWSFSTVSNGSGGVTPPSDTDEGGIQNRFVHISSIDCFAVIVNSGFSASDEMYVYKIPEGGL